MSKSLSFLKSHSLISASPGFLYKPMTPVNLVWVFLVITKTLSLLQAQCVCHSVLIIPHIALNRYMVYNSKL